MLAPREKLTKLNVYLVLLLFKDKQDALNALLVIIALQL